MLPVSEHVFVCAYANSILALVFAVSHQRVCACAICLLLCRVVVCYRHIEQQGVIFFPMCTKARMLTHTRMFKHAHAHAHREDHIVWASDISSKTNGCNFINPCGLAFDLEREQEFLFARACMSASIVCVGQHVTSVGSERAQT